MSETLSNCRWGDIFSEQDNMCSDQNCGTNRRQVRPNLDRRKTTSSAVAVSDLRRRWSYLSRLICWREQTYEMMRWKVPAELDKESLSASVMKWWKMCMRLRCRS